MKFIKSVLLIEKREFFSNFWTISIRKLLKSYKGKFGIIRFSVLFHTLCNLLRYHNKGKEAVLLCLYFPTKLGVRFSTKACMPSLWSRVCLILNWACFSSSSNFSNCGREFSAKIFFVLIIACTGR